MSGGSVVVGDAAGAGASPGAGASRGGPAGGPVLVASDLDRTLIYSASALMLAGPDEGAPTLTVAEVYNGAPLSYLTRPAELGLAALASGRLGGAVFVPVTTRTAAQYRRVRIPGVEPEYAVTTNGGVLLRDGMPDSGWAATVASRVAAASASLDEVGRILPSAREATDVPGGSGSAHPAFVRWHAAEGLFHYAIVERGLLPSADLDALTAACADLGWTVSVQGRKLYVVPAPLTKSAAVAEVASRVGASRVVAAGDSRLDLDLLRFADEAFRPAHGELHDAGVTLPHLRVTAARGVAAGEELVGLLAGAVATAGAVPAVATGTSASAPGLRTPT